MEGAPSPLKGDEKKKAPPKKKKASTKKKKDPNAPKNALSAFMYFSKAKRPEIKEENPEASFGELVSIYYFNNLSYVISFLSSFIH